MKRRSTKGMEMRRMTAMCLATLTAVSAAGVNSTAVFASDATVSESGKGEWDELTTITYYSNDANLQSGVVGGYWADILKQYGLSVDVWAYSDEKTNAILASGSLPDVMCVNKDNFLTMQESGMILNIDEYLDRLPNVTSFDMMDTALNYLREYYSNGTGELYGLPCGVGPASDAKGMYKNMISVNWKYYYELGCPEFKDQWELIDVMKQMQEAYPTGDDGVQNWGTYLNAGSDSSYWGNMQQYFKWFGYEVAELPYLLESDMVNGEYHSILEDDSKYKEGLKWYNTAMREGVMDPESINNDRQTQKAKVDNKHAMVCSGTIQGYGGYMPIYMEGEQVVKEVKEQPYGNDNILVINKNTANLDACLRFVNLLADPDMQMQSIDGPEGELWYQEDGVTYITDEAVETYKKGENWTLSDGQQLALFYLPWLIRDSATTSYVGPDGEARGIRFDSWPEVTEIKYNTENYQQWREVYGYDFYQDQAAASNGYFETSDLDFVNTFASLPDDMMKLTIDTLRDTVVTASWKMVYAEDDESFEAIWDQMVQDCEDLGAQDIIDWRLDDLKQAKAARDALNAE